MFKTVINKIHNSKRFKDEKKLLKGNIKGQSEKRSLLHLSINKSATQFIKKLLRENAKNNDLKFIDFHGYFFNVGHPYFDQMGQNEFNKYQHAFVKTGFVYSSFGGPLPFINDIENFNKLVIVRDPRDVLTSSYFSAAYSHAIPKDKELKKTFLNERNRIREQDINEFVIDKKNSVLRNYESYIDFLGTQKQNQLFEKYEDIISNPDQFLHKLEDVLKFKVYDKDYYLGQMRTTDTKENMLNHKRKMTPGDYKDKLNAKTIEVLNQEFSKVLEYFDYK